MEGKYLHVCGESAWRDDNPVGADCHPTIRPPAYFDPDHLRADVSAYRAACAANHASPTVATYRAEADAREHLMEHITPETACALVEGWKR